MPGKGHKAHAASGSRSRSLSSLVRNTYDPAQELCMREQIGLRDWAPSPFSFKVRAVLEYKGLAYTAMFGTISSSRRAASELLN